MGEGGKVVVEKPTAEQAARVMEKIYQSLEGEYSLGLSSILCKLY